MSSPKSKAKLSVNEHVKVRLNAVKDFLSGRSGEAKAANTADQESREAVAAELLAAMSPANDANAQVKSPDNQDTPDDPLTPASGETQPLNAPPQPEQERARHLFLQHGYFDEAVENLGAAKKRQRREVQ